MEPSASRPEQKSQSTTRPGDRSPGRQRWRRALAIVGRRAALAVRVPLRRVVAAWSRLRPAQQLTLGFASYAAIGTALLCLPWAQQKPAGVVDHLFTVTSAISTTGLSTVSVGETYTFFGEIVILALFQLGGVGYMTLSSVIILARGKPLSQARTEVLRAGFSVPHYFVISRFIVHVAVFTLAIESIGTAVMWWRFSALGLAQPLWSALFHTVSAFATAGFSLNKNSLESFAGDWIVNLAIGVLCYLGAIGFIVVQDVWYSLKWREHMITFTSKVILTMTALVFVVGTVALLLIEPSISALPFGQRLMACSFQVMTASSTAGFNTIPISTLSVAALLVLSLAMVIGASPSGTGGGIKTTCVSALLANLGSVLRGRDRVLWLGHEVPLIRVLYAVAATTLYLSLLAGGVIVLSLVERSELLSLLFEAASALGTVGLSLGITADLSTAAKLILVILMFAGRCGPLTLGLALLRPDHPAGSPPRDDLAV